MSTKQRNAVKALRAIQRRTELATAREASINLRNPLVAWVYAFYYPADGMHFGTRFSATPEKTLKDEPGSRLVPVAGFRNGVCVKSFADDVPVEIPPASARIAGTAPASNGKGWKYVPAR